jgi:hypothetical protein
MVLFQGPKVTVMNDFIAYDRWDYAVRPVLNVDDDLVLQSIASELLPAV